MPTKNIPAIGEVFKGYVPAERQLAHITVGSDTGNDVVVGDIGTYTLVNVDQPIVVFGMWTQTETAWTTSVTITLGDSDSAARYFDDTTINPAASGAVLIASTGLTVPYVYAGAQALLATVAGATLAAGLTHVYLDYAILAD